MDMRDLLEISGNICEWQAARGMCGKGRRSVWVDRMVAPLGRPTWITLMVGNRLEQGVVGPSKWLLQPESKMERWGEWLVTRGVIDKLLETKFTLVVPCPYQVAGL